MRAAVLIPSAILVGIGILWIGQGLGLVHGSFMTGSTFWTIAGAVMVLAGIGILVLAARRGSTP
jgi:hypothetical protein